MPVRRDAAVAWRCSGSAGSARPGLGCGSAPKAASCMSPPSNAAPATPVTADANSPTDDGQSNGTRPATKRGRRDRPRQRGVERHGPRLGACLMARKLIVEIIGDAHEADPLVQPVHHRRQQVRGRSVRVDGQGREVVHEAATGRGRRVHRCRRCQRRDRRAPQGRSTLRPSREQVLGQTQVALESTGKIVGGVRRRRSRRPSREQSQARVRRRSVVAVVLAVRPQRRRSVEEALRRNNIAMDVARARFIDLEQAAALVNKAALGQAGALRRVGIDARTVRRVWSSWRQLEREFGGPRKRRPDTRDRVDGTVQRSDRERSRRASVRGCCRSISSMADGR